MNKNIEINLLINNKAKNFIRKLIKKAKNYNFNDLTIQYFTQFIAENHGVKLYVIFDNINNETEKNIITLGLLSKNDFDPYKIHTNPYTLNYIYTLEKYRRNNYALYMIEYIKKYDKITAFCSNSESENLFVKGKYINYGKDPFGINSVYRYP